MSFYEAAASIGINAAKIGLLMEDDGTSTDQAERIGAAAVLLAEYESHPNFNWEDPKNTWESVCCILAEMLTNNEHVTEHTIETLCRE